MAETTAPEEQVREPNTSGAVDMVVESAEAAAAVEARSKQKRAREEEDDLSHDDNGASKKQKLEKQKEVEDEEQEQEEEKKPPGPVKLGYKTFESSVEMFDYFYKFLHAWSLDIDVNEYEHTMLLELLKNGHTDPEEKIGVGIRAFRVRKHPRWQSRCFFLLRKDDSVDDFSFRKCVDHILPLPEEMQPKPDVDKQLGKGKRRGGRGGGGGVPGGRGRGGSGR